MNGVPMCANGALINDWLRARTAFGAYNGYVVSDCGAVADIQRTHRFANSTTAAVAAAVRGGTDVNCGTAFRDALNASLELGLLSAEDLETAVNRTVVAKLKLGLFDPPGAVPWSHLSMKEVGSQTHMALARRAAQQAIVLVKNDARLLPLDQKKWKVTVIGPNANDTEVQLGNYHGAPVNGTVRTPLQAITSHVHALGGTTTFNQGCWVIGEGSWNFEAAIAAAEAADVAVVVIGTLSKGSAFPADTDGHTGFVDPATEKESLDRTHLSLPGVQLDLVKAIARRTNTPMVVVLVNGAALEVEWLLASERVGAVLVTWYGGQMAGDALVDVLWGKAPPGARLPVTLYRSNWTTASSMLDMSMSKWPGRTHRFVAPEFVLLPFGFGLGFGRFTYEVVSAPRTALPLSRVRKWVAAGANAGHAPPHESLATFTIRVTNNGPADTEHVVLGFLVSPLVVGVAANGEAGWGEDEAAHIHPQQSLFDFVRVAVAAGRSSTVVLTLLVQDVTHVLSDGTRDAVPGKFVAHFGERQSGQMGQGYEELTFEVGGDA